MRGGFLSVFADACAAKDWGAERVTDAAYGVSASYSLLRVDVTMRRGPVPVSPDPRAAGRALLFVGTSISKFK